MSSGAACRAVAMAKAGDISRYFRDIQRLTDRKSTRLNSSHSQISYAVFCLKKKIIYREGVPPRGTRGEVAAPLSTSRRQNHYTALDRSSRTCLVRPRDQDSGWSSEPAPFQV